MTAGEKHGIHAKRSKAWARTNLHGFHDAPPTPFTRDGEVDAPALRHNIDAFVDMGMEGIVVGGFIGEAWNMTLSEWMRYHELVADANAGRMKISTIILDPSARQALEKIEFTRRLGFEVAEVMNPAVQLKSDDEIFAFYKYLTDRSDMAIVLYRTPVSGTVLSLELMQRLADIPTLVGVKQGSLRRSDTYKLRRDLRPDFFVSEPMEQYFLDDLLGLQVPAVGGLPLHRVWQAAAGDSPVHGGCRGRQLAGGAGQVAVAARGVRLH
ncbi:dihydrodipicolinate synthase family protein [Immundisolibacter sp.]